MANLAGGGVTVVGIGQSLKITQYLATAITVADIGKPVKQEAGSNNTVSLAGDGEAFIGVLENYENRVQEGVKTAAIGMKGGYRFTYLSGDTVNVGDYVVAAANGQVKRTTTANNTRVFAKDTTNQTVDVFIL